MEGAAGVTAGDGVPQGLGLGAAAGQVPVLIDFVFPLLPTQTPQRIYLGRMY